MNKKIGLKEAISIRIGGVGIFTVLGLTVALANGRVNLFDTPISIQPSKTSY